MVLIRPDMNGERLETQLTISKMHAPESAKASAPRGGGGTWVFFGLVCAARDSKLAPRSQKKNSPKIDTPFLKWANFLYPVLEFAVKLIPRSRNGPIFYTPF